jgi:AcrR family transcriptional regulator
VNRPVSADSDGRRQRRDRNREAVVQALLSLYNDGNLAPSVDEIAARSGVSARSLFRYFDDVDDIEQQQNAVRHLAVIDTDTTRPLAERAEMLARRRAELFETIESIATVSRLRAPFQLVVADGLTEGRAFLRSQLATLFGPELRQMPPALAAARLATADVIASFESWRLLRDDQRLTRSKAAAAVAEALTALLAPSDHT